MIATIRGTVVFDRKVVSRNWRKINESPLKKAGLLVRKIARGSIRVRKGDKPSPRGSPPRSRAPGKPLKMIFSVPDSFATKTLVGFVGFNKNRVPTPAVHEHGLRARRKVFAPEETQRRSKRTGRFKRKRKVAVTKIVHYPERETMEPALEKARPQIPKFWKDSLKE